MPRPFQLWLRQAAYDYLDGLELAERQRLLVWLDGLVANPSRVGDFVERSADGREFEIALIGRHAIVWWIDDPVREVKVVTIRPADA